MQSLKNLFKVLKKELHTKSYFKKVLFSYILISCVTFLIFSVLILTYVQRQHNNEMIKINEQNIEQAYSVNSSILQNIFNYGYNMLDNATVRSILYGKTYSTVTALEARNVYDNFLKMNSIILSLDFINYSTNTVLSKSGRFTFDNYTDQGLLEWLDSLTPSQTPVICKPRIINYHNGSRYEQRLVLSIIYYTDKRAALVVNLDYKSYLALLNFNKENESFRLLLLNQDSLVMASPDETQFGMDYSAQPLYAKVLEQPSGNGNFLYTDETGKYLVSFDKSRNMGITYISTYSMKYPFHGSSIFLFIIKYSAGYLIVTLLLSILSSCFIYNPVKKLKKTIYDTHQEDIGYIERNHTNDFEFFESIYQNLINNNISLNKANLLYKQEKLENLLKKLLDNSAAQLSITAEQLESIDAHFLYLNYAVFLMESELNMDAADAERDLNTIQFVIINITTELMEPYAQIKAIEASPSRLVFVCNFEAYDKKSIKEVMLKIQNFFHNINLFRLSISFGEVVTELENLSHSYETAKEALFRSVLSGDGSILFYDEMNKLPLNLQHYPYDADKEIIAALKAQDSAGCRTGILQFFRQIGNYQYHQFHRCILQLDAALQRYEYTNGLNAASSEEITSLLSSPILEKLQSYYIMRCEDDIASLIEIKMHSSAKTELTKQINDYVEENIYNPNLSVAMIAGKVNLSVNYLRNIYKENTGESLTAYISNRKLALVCAMLSDTDIPIRDISDKLGFTTKNYFFTFFKKHMNMTPMQYRSQYKK